MFLEPIVESSFPETRDIGVSTYLRVCVPKSILCTRLCIYRLSSIDACASAYEKAVSPLRYLEAYSLTKERKYLPVRNAILPFLFICIKISLWHVTQREKRDKKKQSNELVLSNRSSPIYPDKARASYLYIILHKFWIRSKHHWWNETENENENVSFLVDPNYPNNTYSVDNVEAFDG